MEPGVSPECVEDTTTMTRVAGSTSDVDLDLRREFASAMQEQVQAIRNVQLQLEKCTAHIAVVGSGMASQTSLLQGLVRMLGKTEPKLDDDLSPRLKLPAVRGASNPYIPENLKYESNETEVWDPHEIQKDGSESIYPMHAPSSSQVSGHRRASEPCTPRMSGQRRASEPCTPRRRSSGRGDANRLPTPAASDRSILSVHHGLEGMTESIEAHTVANLRRTLGKPKTPKPSPNLNQLMLPKPAERDEVQLLNVVADEAPRLPSPPTPQRHEIERMRSKMRRMSMDELRDKYDQCLVRSNTISKPLSVPEEGSSALGALGWTALGAAGIVDFRVGRPWQILSWCFTLLPLGLAAGATAVGVLEGQHYMPMTLSCFALGTALSVANLRWQNMSTLLGPEEQPLDEYAQECGFYEDWKRVSRRRFREVFAVAVLMVFCRFISAILLPSELLYSGLADGSMGIVMDLLFLCVSFRVAVVAYTQLHICAGLELSVDCFCVKFFHEMDIEQAIHEWNMVQANLRQVSNQLSGSCFLTAAACFASMLLLAEQMIRAPESMQDARQALLWLGWLYPPSFYFFYVMLRAAGVTEKAMRVGPLVNSWKFEGDEEVSWINHQRQYVVQYINQSQAGFCMKGVRITGFDVQKMAYYFAALTFTLVSRSLTTFSW